MAGQAQSKEIRSQRGIVADGTITAKWLVLYGLYKHNIFFKA